MAIDPKLIDKLPADYMRPEDIVGGNRVADASDQCCAGAGSKRRTDGPLGISKA